LRRGSARLVSGLHVHVLSSAMHLMYNLTVAALLNDDDVVGSALLLGAGCAWSQQTWLSHLRLAAFGATAGHDSPANGRLCCSSGSTLLTSGIRVLMVQHVEGRHLCASGSTLCSCTVTTCGTAAALVFYQLLPTRAMLDSRCMACNRLGFGGTC
jgi:hypothetical protein